jgi:hypothetical protein
MKKILFVAAISIAAISCGESEEKSEERKTRTATELGREACKCYRAADTPEKYNECTRKATALVSEVSSDEEMKKYYDILHQCDDTNF